MTPTEKRMLKRNKNQTENVNSDEKLKTPSSHKSLKAKDSQPNKNM